MIYKYYVFELCTIEDESKRELSVTCKFYRWWNPIKCLQAAKNQLQADGLKLHKIKRFYRIN